MRYKKSALIARRNKILPIFFVRQNMTTYSGLTLVDHYFRLYQIHHRIKKSMKPFKFKGDYCIGDILFILLIMLILGAERLHHVDYLRNDPLFCRVIGLTKIPHRTKISRSLKQFASDSLKTLIELNSGLVCEKLNELGLTEITIDLDGTVISTRGNPTWAFKGYNPIKKGAKSYFPLTAHVAETGHFVSIVNRPGNVHDSNRALAVIQMVRRQLSDFKLKFRTDSAFCVPEVISYLLRKNIGFAIKAPFWKLNRLKEVAEQRKRWFRIDQRWSYFWVTSPIDSVDEPHYVLILRKRLKKTDKPFQLQLFSPNNGIYEYSAIVTGSKSWQPENLVSFVAGRSAQETSIGELKTNFSFDHIPTDTYQANSAYMQISQMAYNLSLSMQHSMGLTQNRKPTDKRTRIYKSMEWKTVRFLLLNRAGRIAWNKGKKVLEMTQNKNTQSLYEKISSSLNEIKFQKAA